LFIEIIDWVYISAGHGHRDDGSQRQPDGRRRTGGRTKRHTGHPDDY